MHGCQNEEAGRKDVEWIEVVRYWFQWSTLMNTVICTGSNNGMGYHNVVTIYFSRTLLRNEFNIYKYYNTL